MIEHLLKKKYFYPNDYKKTVYDIDLKQLKSKGINYILIDLDNTLIPYDVEVPNAKIEILFKNIELNDLQFIIISNNKKHRVDKFCSRLGCKYIYSARKPLKRGFKQALKLLGNPPVSEVCLIGDQFMTDVFGGNRMGFYTIVVDAIKRKTEKWYTKFNRYLEKRVLLRLKKTDECFYNKLCLEEKV